MRRLSLVVAACAGALATAAPPPRFGVAEDLTKNTDDDPVRFDPVGFWRR